MIYSINLTKCFISLVCFIFLNNTFNAQWVLSIDKDSIQVYNKPNSDGYSYYKANGYVYADINSIYYFLRDIANFPEWVNNCTETKLLDKKGEELIYFALYEMPWPVSDRYSITRLTVEEKTDKVIQLQSNPSAETSYSYEDGLRITRFNEQVSLTKINDRLTYIEMYGAYDPGGAIPSWLTDKFMKYGPYDAIMAIKERLE